MPYTLNFFGDQSQLENSEYNPQSNTMQGLFKMTLNIQLMIDANTLKEIITYKDASLKHQVMH